MSAIRMEGSVAVVRTPARFGFASDASLVADIDAVIARGARGVVFDLNDTMMLSSAGIRVIVQTAERRETKGRVRAAGLDPQIGQVLKLVRIDSIVPVHPTVEAAIAACLAAGA